MAREPVWKEIQSQGGIELSIDETSVVPLNDAVSLDVTWRRTKDGKTVETVSTVDCAFFQMVNTKSSVVTQSFFQPPPAEFIKPGRKEPPVKYAYYGTPEGAVIDRACSLGQPQALSRLQEPNIECNTETPQKSVIDCLPSAGFRANLLLFTLRTRDLVPLCHEDKRKAEALHAEIFLEAFQCQDQQCAEDAIGYGLNIVSKDLEAARTAELTHSGEPVNCYAVVSLSARIEKRLQDEALHQYHECVREKLPKAKKGLSEPAKIAKAAHAMCLNAFANATAAFGNRLTDAEYYALQEPNFVKWVQERLREAQGSE